MAQAAGRWCRAPVLARSTRGCGVVAEPADEFAAGADAQPPVHVAQMVVYGANGQQDLGRDLATRPALRRGVGDTPFVRGERAGATGRTGDACGPPRPERGPRPRPCRGRPGTRPRRRAARGTAPPRPLDHADRYRLPRRSPRRGSIGCCRSRPIHCRRPIRIRSRRSKSRWDSRRHWRRGHLGLPSPAGGNPQCGTRPLPENAVHRNCLSPFAASGQSANGCALAGQATGPRRPRRETAVDDQIQTTAGWPIARRMSLRGLSGRR